MKVRQRGATLGKLALGLRIVRADGAQLSLRRAPPPPFPEVMITPLVPLAIGYLMAGLHRAQAGVAVFWPKRYVIRSA